MRLKCEWFGIQMKVRPTQAPEDSANQSRVAGTSYTDGSVRVQAPSQSELRGGHADRVRLVPLGARMQELAEQGGRRHRLPRSGAGQLEILTPGGPGEHLLLRSEILPAAEGAQQHFAIRGYCLARNTLSELRSLTDRTAQASNHFGL